MRVPTLVLLLGLALLALIAYTARAEDTPDIDAVGRVGYVIDGDTISVYILRVNQPVSACSESVSLRPGASITVRLADIDTPELGEPGYEEAREALEQLIHGEIVHIDVDDYNCVGYYGRVVAVIYLEHNETHLLNVNKWLLKEGYAREYNFTNNEFDPRDWSLYVSIFPWDDYGLDFVRLEGVGNATLSGDIEFLVTIVDSGHEPLICFGGGRSCESIDGELGDTHRVRVVLNDADGVVLRLYPDGYIGYVRDLDIEELYIDGRLIASDTSIEGVYGLRIIWADKGVKLAFTGNITLLEFNGDQLAAPNQEKPRAVVLEDLVPLSLGLGEAASITGFARMLANPGEVPEAPLLALLALPAIAMPLTLALYICLWLKRRQGSQEA